MQSGQGHEMRDVLAGGILVTRDATVLAPCRSPFARRRRLTRSRDGVCALPPPPSSAVQPGQLASPFLKFGFPSLSLH